MAVTNGKIKVVENPDGSLSAIVNGVERGKYVNAQEGLLFLGLCIAHIDELKSQLDAIKAQYEDETIKNIIAFMEEHTEVINDSSSYSKTYELVRDWLRK